MIQKNILSNSSITIDIISIIVVAAVSCEFWVNSFIFILWMSIEHWAFEHWAWMFTKHCLERGNALCHDDDVILYQKWHPFYLWIAYNFNYCVPNIATLVDEWKRMNWIHDLTYFGRSAGRSVLSVSRLNDQRSQRPKCLFHCHLNVSYLSWGIE